MKESRKVPHPTGSSLKGTQSLQDPAVPMKAGGQPVMSIKANEAVQAFAELKEYKIRAGPGSQVFFHSSSQQLTSVHKLSSNSSQDVRSYSPHCCHQHSRRGALR
jgi:hypothetical protein